MDGAGKGQARNIGHWFDVIAHYASRGMGHPISFVLALLLIAGWAIGGPFSGFSNGWQLLINTGTTICTFLMVFLIQHTQNRDSAALHLKLDELLRAIEGAHNATIAVEDLDEADLLKLQREYRRIAEGAQQEDIAPHVQLSPEFGNTDGVPVPMPNPQR